MTKKLLSQRKVNSFSTTPTSTIDPQRGTTSFPLFDRISLSQITTYHWSLRESLRGLLTAGAPAIGLWNRKIYDTEPARAVELVIDSGLKVSTISVAGGFTGYNEYSYDEAISDAIQLIKFAGQVNAAAVQVVSGPRAGHTLNHARDLTLDALNTLGDAAAFHGTKLALKPMEFPLAQNWTFLNSIHSTLELIDACQHPAVGISVNPVQLQNVENWHNLLSEMAPLITAVQISEFESCGTLPNSFPGFEIIEAIDNAGYEGFFELEIWSERVWNSDYQNLLSQLRLACQTEASSQY
ncbi:MAG: TIM barrel protein [Gimesia sp.]|nr:TIM barrel protein [Gimesia sp.]